jgi:CDP-paratose 2-epimerase
LKRLGVHLFHGDIRVSSDLDTLPATDWVIDAAAQPSVLAGRDGKTSTRQLLEHNLLGTSGVGEGFSTEAPISLYGATKLASERLAQEYAAGFQMPLWINRCGVLAGAGQFGSAEQGIFSYWLHAHLARRPLKYLWFGGRGFQVRDALHPSDLARLVDFQFAHWGTGSAPQRFRRPVELYVPGATDRLV